MKTIKCEKPALFLYSCQSLFFSLHFIAFKKHYTFLDFVLFRRAHQGGKATENMHQVLNSTRPDHRFWFYDDVTQYGRTKYLNYYTPLVLLIFTVLFITYNIWKHYYYYDVLHLKQKIQLMNFYTHLPTKTNRVR